MISAKDEQGFFELTSEFIQYTSQNIFLTGKAGTGKTTFLRHIKEKCDKKLVVIAPTGVAAINAGGVTMHSFFQLPLGCFVPGSWRGNFQSENPVTDRHHLLSNLRLSNEKRELIQNLELCIIDEVSMLRCDWLDAMDVLLRYIRKNNHEPFGGVQMLFIGDLYQLPPVANDTEWQWLKEYYKSPFFFEALVFQQAKPLCIELKKIYRQSDANFIHLLNRIRNNRVDEDDLEKLHQLYKPGYRPNPDEHFITLTTHNRKADEINASELKRLAGKEFICEATTTGEFPDRIYPAEKSMRLKPGAQIMFIKNDIKEKKYFNGKIGVIDEVNTNVNQEFMRVRFPETNEVIVVNKETWRNIRYSFNEQENKIDENELGSFTQYPIRLAWAVTIHKSQGLTFERAVIDAGSAFAAGQVYVALSRCVSMEGIVLLSPIRQHVIMTDQVIVDFMSEQNTIEALLPILAKEKEIYLIKKTMQLFNLQPIIEKIRSFIPFMGERKLEGKENIILSLHKIHDAIVKLENVAEKFRAQVQQLTANGLSDVAQQQLNERVEKAKNYFEKELDAQVNVPLAQLNKEVQQQNKVRKVLKEMKAFILFFEHFTLRYSVDVSKKQQVIQKSEEPVALAKPITQEAFQNLFNMLKGVRKNFAEDENVAPYLICHDTTLRELATFLPQDMSDMAIIKGMGDRTLNKYGEKFLSAVINYCSKNNLESKMSLKEAEIKTTKRNKTAGVKTVDTQTQSLQLYQSGKTIAEIAAIRSLSETTIESHIAFFIRTGVLDVFNFLLKEKFELIKEALQKTTASGLTPVKIKLGDAASYGEIKFVIAATQRDKNSSV